MKILAIISGIGHHDYGLETLQKHPIYADVAKKYDTIVEIRYQQILDHVTDTVFLDPIKFGLSPSGWKAEKHIKDELIELCYENDVDVMTHSLASWIIYKIPAKINNLYMIASPIGFISPLARTAVYMNIGFPKIHPEKHFYIHSHRDPVSMIDPCKRYLLSDNPIRLVTATGHGMDQYLSYIKDHTNLF